MATGKRSALSSFYPDNKHRQDYTAAAVDMGIPHYQIQHKLGISPTATVLVASQKLLNRQVAIKLINGDLLKTAEQRSALLANLQRVAKLSHPNIAAIHDCGIIRQHLFVVMDFFKAGSLAERQSQLSIEEIIDMLYGLASALDYAHQHRVIHGAIRPQNILFQSDARVVLSDFGISPLSARHTATDLNTSERLFYRSPEQIKGRKIDHRTDFYALGLILYDCLRLSDGRAAIPNAHLVRPRRFRPAFNELPAAAAVFQPLLDKLLSEYPDDRFDNAGELLDAIDAIDTRLSSAAKPLASPEKPPKLRYWLAVAGIVAAFIAGSVFYTVLQKQPGKPLLAGESVSTSAPRATETQTTVSRPTVPGGQTETGQRQDASSQPMPSLITVTGDSEKTITAMMPSATTADDTGTDTGTDAVRLPDYISALLTKAAAQTRSLQLSIPKDDNAVVNYQKVLILDPGNTRAREGLQEIADKYLQFAQQKLRSGQLQTSIELLVRARDLDPKNEQLTARIEQLHTEISQFYSGPQQPKQQQLSAIDPKSAQAFTDKPIRSRRELPQQKSATSSHRHSTASRQTTVKIPSQSPTFSFDNEGGGWSNNR